jgi:hypothetical protein
LRSSHLFFILPGLMLNDRNCSKGKKILGLIVPKFKLQLAFSRAKPCENLSLHEIPHSNKARRRALRASAI